VREAHGFPEHAQPLELVGMRVARHRQVVPAGLQVLPERQHVHVVRTQVGHHLLDLRDFLPQAEHQSRLGRH